MSEFKSEESLEKKCKVYGNRESKCKGLKFGQSFEARGILNLLRP